MQKEARMLFNIKKVINETARIDSPIAMLRQKIMLEDRIGRLRRMKDISGRGYGIMKRYIEKKIPREKYCETVNEVRKRPRPVKSDNLTEKEFDRLVARSNDAF